MASGTLIFFAKPPRGFGFIKPDDGGRDVFIHMREIRNYFDPFLLVPGVKLYYDIIETDRGPKAANVRLTPTKERGSPIVETTFDFGLK